MRIGPRPFNQDGVLTEGSTHNQRHGAWGGPQDRSCKSGSTTNTANARRAPRVEPVGQLTIWDPPKEKAPTYPIMLTDNDPLSRKMTNYVPYKVDKNIPTKIDKFFSNSDLPETYKHHKSAIWKT